MNRNHEWDSLRLGLTALHCGVDVGGTVPGRAHLSARGTSPRTSCVKLRRTLAALTRRSRRMRGLCLWIRCWDLGLVSTLGCALEQRLRDVLQLSPMLGNLGQDGTC